MKAGVAIGFVIFAVLVWIASWFGRTKAGFLGTAVLFALVCFVGGIILKYRPDNLRRVWLCAALCALGTLGELYAFMGLVIAPASSRSYGITAL